MYICSHSLNQVDVMCLLDILLSPKIPYWEGILLVHPTPWAKYLCHLCPPYLPTCGISLPLQVKFSCAIFKTLKILLFVPPFLSSWGSSRKLDITWDFLYLNCRVAWERIRSTSSSRGFDKPWVTHLRENYCCPTNLCTWRPNTIYKNRSA